MEFADPMFGQYDRVYMAKVFTFTPDYPHVFPCEVVKGGTGIGIMRGSCPKKWNTPAPITGCMIILRQ